MASIHVGELTMALALRHSAKAHVYHVPPSDVGSVHACRLRPFGGQPEAGHGGYQGVRDRACDAHTSNAGSRHRGAQDSEAV